MTGLPQSRHKPLRLLEKVPSDRFAERFSFTENRTANVLHAYSKGNSLAAR